MTAGGQLTAYGGILVDSTTSGAGLSVGTAQQFQVDGTGNATTANLTVSKNLSGYTGSFSHVVCTRAFCNADLSVTGTGTFNSVSTNSLTTGGLVSTAGLSATGTGTFGSLQATGDLVYNAGKSLMSQISTLNNLRTSGSLTSTSTFQNAWAPGTNTRGIIYAAAGGPCYSTASAFFEYLTGFSYGSLTLLSQCGNAAQLALNTSNASTGGTVNITLQQSGGFIQVKTSTVCVVQWYVVMF